MSRHQRYQSIIFSQVYNLHIQPIFPWTVTSPSSSVAKDPVPVTCPIAGMFNFTQTGDEPLTTRLLGGPTAEPWDGIYCKQNISEFSVCDEEQKEIWIDAEACITVNAYGQEVDIYSGFS